MEIREYMQGQLTDVMTNRRDALKSAKGWVELLQSNLADENALGLQNYRKDLVEMSMTIHTLETGAVSGVEELNKLMTPYGLSYEAD